MNSKKLNLDELYELVITFFKGKLSMQTISEGKGEITGVLYDAFFFSCGIDPQYQCFEAGIHIHERITTSYFLGEKISLNNTKGDIIKSLELIDKYCQLRLPDKYLQEYFKHH